jgi:signal transduction histidine kinase
MYAEVLASLQPDAADASPPAPDAATRRYARAALDTIHASTATMQRLVEDLLDAPRVVQLLSNLVGNAVKFTPAGGVVTVRYAVVPAGDGAPDGAPGGALVGSVADTGPGIAADDLPHLFTAFWHGDRRGRRGVGLGLWIARAIVEAHGGELRVDSRPGAGTTFHFTLPLADVVRRRED